MDDFDLIRNSALFVDKMFAEVLIMYRRNFAGVDLKVWGSFVSHVYYFFFFKNWGQSEYP